ncbi:MAG: hypothetical protein O3A92_02290 [Verrucomicrobia bacterium]|nr:hypothetical protein [Verrucomicrobiota bacterium]
MMEPTFEKLLVFLADAEVRFVLVRHPSALPSRSKSLRDILKSMIGHLK